MSSRPGGARPGRGAGEVRQGAHGLGALTAVAAALASSLVVWSAGELSGRHSGGRWPSTPPSMAGAVAVRVLLHPGEPALAWPPADRSLLPGAPWYYACAAAIAILTSGLAIGAWRLLEALRSRPWSAPRSAARGAAWARRRELEALVVRDAASGRLVLGSCGRRLLAAESRQSVIVVGPTQSHKTTGFAVPALLEWGGPVIATSVKSDLARDTIACRRGLGEAWLYDPTGTSGMPAVGWSPLRGSSTWPEARRMAAALCGSARSRGDGMAEGDFWYATAAKLLAPLLFAAARSGRTMADVVEWVDTQEVHDVAALLSELGVVEAERAAQATWARDERQLSSVYTTTETVLEAFADPAVAASASRPELHPSALLDGGANTLYVCAPSHEQSRLRPVFAALVSEILTAAYLRVAATGRPLDPPLLVVLDEAANIAPLPELDALAATAASHGIQLVTIWQDIAQISARYGSRAATVVNNHRAKVVLSGISDPATLEHVSALVGDEELVVASTTTDPYGSVSTTESLSTRRLAPADLLRRIRPGHGVLVYGHLPPARIRLRPWYRDARLSAAARGS